MCCKQAQRTGSQEPGGLYLQFSNVLVLGPFLFIIYYYFKITVTNLLHVNILLIKMYFLNEKRTVVLFYSFANISLFFFPQAAP